MSEVIFADDAKKKLNASLVELFSWVSDNSNRPGKHGNARQFEQIKSTIRWSKRLAIGFLVALVLLLVLEVIFFSRASDGALSLSWVAPPLAIMASMSAAVHIGSMQLKAHLYRAQVEHASKLADSAPDIIDCMRGLNELCEHLHENARHYAREGACEKPESTVWGRVMGDLKRLVCGNPACLAELSGKLIRDPAHKASQENVQRLLAFFEKSAIAIRHGYADDSVLWERYNHAAIDCYVCASPLIIAAHLGHQRSPYRRAAKSLGLPYEHYETWLYWRTQDDPEINKLIVQLRAIREEVITKLTSS